MPTLTVKLEGDNCWPDLPERAEVIPVEHIEVALLAGGMSSGAASVAIRIDLPDGRTVIAQTSHALFDMASRAFRGRLEYLEDLRRRGGASS